MLVCTLGDLLLDVVVRLEAPLAPGDDVAARTVVGPGGQAANVAAWVVALGERARFLGVRGEGEGGRLAEAALARRGVEVHGPLRPGSGVVVSLVSPDGGRTMASDRGPSATLRADDVFPGLLDGCDHLHVSGYALASEPARSAARRAAALAHAGGARVSVDLAAVSVLAGLGPVAREVVASLGPHAVLGNEEEVRAFGVALPGVAWIVKRGARGASFDGDQRPAEPVDRVVDTTGAGDALAAGWIVGGPEVALRAAARCVSRAGAMPCD